MAFEPPKGVYRSSNAEIAGAYRQTNAGTAQAIQNFWNNLEEDGRSADAVRAVLAGMPRDEAIRRFNLGDATGKFNNAMTLLDSGSNVPYFDSALAQQRSGEYERLAQDYANRPDSDIGDTRTGPRYRLVNTPDGQQIQDNQAGTRFSLNMATPEMLAAVGMGDQPSTRPANAATLPGQTAPASMNGAVQENIYSPEGVRSTTSAGTTFTPFTPPPSVQAQQQPAPAPAAVQTAQQSGRWELPRFALPTDIDYTGSAGSIFGGYMGTGAGVSSGAGFQPPPGVQVRMAEAAPVGVGAGAGFQPPADVAAAAGQAPAAARPAPRWGLSATGGSGLTTQVPPPADVDDIPPDPGGETVYDPTTNTWVPSRPGGGQSGGGGTETVPPTAGGGGQQTPAPAGMVWRPTVKQVQATDNRGNPIPGQFVTTQEMTLVPDPTYQQPGAAAAQGAQTAAAYSGMANAQAMLPYQIDQALANIGLTNAQVDRIKALLPGELQIQGATVAQVYAAIDNAAKQLGLQVDQFAFNKAATEAQLTGRYGDQFTLPYQQTYGFGPDGTPTLQTRQFQHQQGLDYAASERADLAANLQRAGVTGYYNDAPTLQREQLVSDTERANLLAQASIGNTAAQIRLREIDQAETARQFDTTTEMAWRQNPSSVFDRVWESRGGGAGGGFQLPDSQRQQQAAAGFAMPQNVQQPQAQPALTFAGAGFQPPPSQRSALSYGEIRAAGAEPPAVAAATSGARAMPRYRPAGGMPVVSGQAYNQLTQDEQDVFNAQLRATGNNPADYHNYRQRLTARPVRTGGFAAPRSVAATL